MTPVQGHADVSRGDWHGRNSLLKPRWYSPHVALTDGNDSWDSTRTFTGPDGKAYSRSLQGTNCRVRCVSEALLPTVTLIFVPSGRKKGEALSFERRRQLSPMKSHAPYLEISLAVSHACWIASWSHLLIQRKQATMRRVRLQSENGYWSLVLFNCIRVVDPWSWCVTAFSLIGLEAGVVVM
ncbi:hypothetical protein EDD17DRAFT_254183 [Pisolithus thermaeus]|nr:hypothetical protein EDD17DRAFT_254183 [Pisolithus thermaeus]